MNEIWELSTTYNMEQWKHDKMAAHNFFFNSCSGWRKDGKSEKSKNLSRHCRLITKKSKSRSRQKAQGIEMNNESINHKLRSTLIPQQIRK